MTKELFYRNNAIFYLSTIESHPRIGTQELQIEQFLIEALYLLHSHTQYVYYMLTVWKQDTCIQRFK